MAWQLLPVQEQLQGPAWQQQQEQQPLPAQQRTRSERPCDRRMRRSWSLPSSTCRPCKFHLFQPALPQVPAHSPAKAPERLPLKTHTSTQLADSFSCRSLISLA